MHGQLTARSATDVCRELAEAGATGVLFITGLQASGRLVFDRGRLVAASSPTPGSRLGDRLVNGGLLDEEALAGVLEEQQDTPDSARSRLGQLLVDRGLVPLEAVRRVIEEQLLDAVFDLAGWRDGSYRFETDATFDTPEVPLAISVDQALVEVARRRDEWAALSEVIPDLDAVPQFRPGANTSTAALEPDEFAVMASVDGARSVRDLAYDLGYGEFEAARIVYALNLVGLVDVAPPVDEIGAALDDALSFVGYEESDHPTPDASDDAATTPPAAEESGPAAAPSQPSGPEDSVAPAGIDQGAPEPAAEAQTAEDEETPAAADDPFDSSIFDEVWGEPGASDVSEVSDVEEEPEPWSSGPDADEPPDATAPATDTPATAGSPRAADSPPAVDADTTLEADLPRLSGYDELRRADRHVAEQPPSPEPAPEPAADQPRQRTPRSPSPGAGGDVSEFLRELSRLALDEEVGDLPEEQDEQPAPRREPDPPPRPAASPPRDEGRKKKRGLFGFGG